MFVEEEKPDKAISLTTRRSTVYHSNQFVIFTSVFWGLKVSFLVLSFKWMKRNNVLSYFSTFRIQKVLFSVASVHDILEN